MAHPLSLVQELRPHRAAAALLHRYAQKLRTSLFWIGGDAESLPKLMALYASYWQRSMRAALLADDQPVARTPVVQFATLATVAARESLAMLKASALVLCVHREVQLLDVPLMAHLASSCGVIHVLLQQPPRCASVMAELLAGMNGIVRLRGLAPFLTCAAARVSFE